jgi:AAA domain (dynein-related subfamily)
VLPYSGSSSFSLTPNFQRSTIFMYAEVRKPTVWATSTRPDNLSLDSLMIFLRRVVQETETYSADIPVIVQAIRTRLIAASSGSTTRDGTEAQPASALSVSACAQSEPLDDVVRVDDRLWQMILTAIASSTAVILVGPPGTGKSALLRQAVDAISASRQAEGLAGVKTPLWVTPDESWTSRELIGGETVVGGEIVFRPGWVLRSIADDRWLVLDEANRGDLDRIFGALLTWLSGGVVIVGVESAEDSARLIELAWTSGLSRVETVDGTSDGEPGRIRYLASKDEWKLLGTYNALDAQRVFRIGAALGRRFVRVPIPSVTPENFRLILRERADDLGQELRGKITLLYKAHYDDEVTKVGPAQFLGMCSYLRFALIVRSPISVNTEPAATEPATASEPSDGAEEIDIAANDIVADSDSAASVREGGLTITPSIADSILSEAYVLNLGTFLAQLEESDLEQLAYRIQTSSALTQKEVEWVSQMIRALA